MKAVVSGYLKVFRACKNCGGKNPEGKEFCPSCGAVAPPVEFVAIEPTEAPLTAAMQAVGITSEQLPQESPQNGDK
jgi:hypothetical protein